MATFLEGNTLLIDGTFRDEKGSLINPHGILFSYRGPSGTVGELTEDQVEQIHTGKFRAPVFVDKPGKWTFRWECAGVRTAAGEQTVTVIQRKT